MKYFIFHRVFCFRILFFIIYFGYVSVAYALNVYVSPEGNDKFDGASPIVNNGTNLNGPFATIERARDQIRYLRKNNKIEGAVNVILADGVYRISEPIVFGPQDSGTKLSPVSYRAAPGAKPTITGGLRIREFRNAGGGLYFSDLTGGAYPTNWYFEQLFVNGKRAIRARTPNYPKVFKILDFPSVGLSSQDKRHSFYVGLSDLKEINSPTDFAMTDLEVVVQHSWETSRLRVESIIDDGKVNLASSAFWEFKKLKGDQGFYFENFLAALDAENEWFLDRYKNVLYYKSDRADFLINNEVFAPYVDKFLVIKGDSATKDKVEYIEFIGLSFIYGQSLLGENGYSDTQAAVNVPATIEVDFAEHISFDACELRHVGSYGIWFRRGVKYSVIRNCVFSDIGAGGVKVGEVEEPAEYFSETSHNLIEFNVVKDIGHRFEGAVGIWVGQSGNNKISRNDISETGYTGISVGWRWGYASSSAKNNIIEYNCLKNIGRGTLSDMGAIYLLGPADGTKLNHNSIVNVTSYDRYGKGGWGIYADEGTSNVVIENNFVFRAKTGGFHQHYGRANVIRNNIFALSYEDGQIKRSRIEKDVSFVFEKNIVYWDYGPLFYGYWGDAGVVLKNNIYYFNGKNPFAYKDTSLIDWLKANVDEGSIMMDPGFVDPKNGNFLLKENAAAFSIGFNWFDPQDAGRTECKINN